MKFLCAQLRSGSVLLSNEKSTLELPTAIKMEELIMLQSPLLG